jgi:ribonuclease HI
VTPSATMPRTISARYPSTCTACGGAVAEGEQISSVPAGSRSRWVHERCAAAELPLDPPASAAAEGRHGAGSAVAVPVVAVPAGTTEVWTDGACSGNPGPGGWAWAVPDGRQASGAAAATTNQRMEIQAALEAVRALPGPLVIVSDSTYVVNCFRDGWWRGWLARGWVNSAKKPVANRDLWEPLVALVTERGDVTFRWVKGHSGDVMNDLVDRLAVEQAKAVAAG